MRCVIFIHVCGLLTGWDRIKIASLNASLGGVWSCTYARSCVLVRPEESLTYSGIMIGPRLFVAL